MDYIYCSKCGEKNSISEDYCIECGSILRKLDKYESGDRITSFEDMFTQKHKEQLNETPLTNEIYELILDNIYETGILIQGMNFNPFLFKSSKTSLSFTNLNLYLNKGTNLLILNLL